MRVKLVPSQTLLAGAATCAVAFCLSAPASAAAKTVMFCIDNAGESPTFKSKPRTCVVYTGPPNLELFSYNLVGVYRLSWQRWGGANPVGRGRGSNRSAAFRYTLRLSRRFRCDDGSSAYRRLKLTSRSPSTRARTTTIRLALPEFC